MPLIAAPPPSEKPVSPTLSRFAVVLASFAAIRAVAFAEADPVGAAESTFLALLVSGVLAAIATIALRPAWELGWTAILSTTAIWIVGYGPHRGALVTLVLLGGLVLAAVRASRSGDVLRSPGKSAALALGLQLLMRCDLLLPPLLDLRTLVSVLALPVASGIALSVLSRHFEAQGRQEGSSASVRIAAAAVVVLAPG